MLALLLILPLQASSQTKVAPESPRLAVGLPLQFVKPIEQPDYDREVLIPLREAQREAAAREAAKEAARLADLKAKCDQRGGKLTGEDCVMPPPPPARIVASAPTGNGYTPGQCTAFVASKRAVPSNWGNAAQWLGHAQSEGWSTGVAPKVGAIAQTTAGGLGHVAIVTAVVGATVQILEQNGPGGPFTIDYRWAAAAEFDYIY